VESIFTEGERKKEGKVSLSFLLHSRQQYIFGLDCKRKAHSERVDHMGMRYKSDTWVRTWTTRKKIWREIVEKYIHMYWMITSSHTLKRHLGVHTGSLLRSKRTAQIYCRLSTCIRRKVCFTFWVLVEKAQGESYVCSHCMSRSLWNTTPSRILWNVLCV